MILSVCGLSFVHSAHIWLNSLLNKIVSCVLYRMLHVLRVVFCISVACELVFGQCSICHNVSNGQWPMNTEYRNKQLQFNCFRMLFDNTFLSSFFFFFFTCLSLCDRWMVSAIWVSIISIQQKDHIHYFCRLFSLLLFYLKKTSAIKWNYMYIPIFRHMKWCFGWMDDRKWYMYIVVHVRYGIPSSIGVNTIIDFIFINLNDICCHQSTIEYRPSAINPARTIQSYLLCL